MTDDAKRALDLYSLLATGGREELMVMTVIPGAPPSKARPKFTRAGITYQSKEDRAAEARTRDHLRELFDEPETGNVALACVFFRPNFQRIDTDNMLKHVSDAANGVAWIDDSQVTAVVGITEYDPELPRTVIAIGRHTSTMTRGTDLVRECVVCGTVFHIERPSMTRKTCSPACTVRLRGGRPATEPLTCPQCGTSFFPGNSYQRLCSPECRAARIAGSNRARVGEGVPLSNCLDCGRQLAHSRGGRCRECWRASVAAVRSTT